MANKSLKRKLDDITQSDEPKDSEEPQTKKQKLNLGSDQQENSSNISQNLARAAGVCQHWWLVSQDESLSWTLLKAFQFMEDERASAQYSGRPSYSESYDTARKKTLPDAGAPVKIKGMALINYVYFLLLEDSAGNIAAIARDDYSFHVHHSPELLDVLENKSDCYRLTLEKIDDTPVIDEYTHKTRVYHIAFEVNVAKLERRIRAGENIEALSYFRDAAFTTFNASRFKSECFNIKESYLPVVLPVITEQPSQLKGVKLHNYQISAINWMTTTEQEIDKKYEVSPLMKTSIPSLLLKCNIQEQKLVLFENANEHNISFNPRGGVLADEMGLGKTMEMLGLIVSNPMKEGAPKTAPYFATKATLVLCPNHLVDQWVKEIESHTEPKLNVIQLTTIAQVKKITYQQIIDADVVVVTYNLLKNKNYLAYPNHGTQIKMDAAAPHDRIDRVDKMLEDLKTKAPEKIKGVILDHFHWHRIVLDEGHEVMKDEFTTDVIYYLQRTFAWYMSGTPFPNEKSFEGARTFLDMFVKQTSEEEMEKTKEGKEYRYRNWDSRLRKPLTEVYVDTILNQLLVDNLVWRNTKESVTEEYQMVATKPEVVLLDFTPVEAAIYEELVFVMQCYSNGSGQFFGGSYNSWRKDPVREFCCKLNYNWGSTLDEMREFMIKKKIQDIQTQKERILQHEITKTSFEAELAKPTRQNDAWYIQSANRYIADYQKNLTQFEKVLADLEKLKKLFEDLTPRDTSKKLEYNTKDYWIENYGTKLASLVGYLQNLFKKEPTTRVIIFSQFTDYLDMIAALLEENNINSSMVEGNVYKKSKALKKFKADESDVQVILLSLSKAASGTNLIEASRVLLMDPMTGTKEEAQAYENQAIGRAQRQGQTKPVTIVRFVIKNTVEHEFYIRNTGTKQHGQVMLNRSNSKLVRGSSFGTLLANNNN